MNGCRSLSFCLEEELAGLTKSGPCRRCCRRWRTAASACPSGAGPASVRSTRGVCFPCRSSRRRAGRTGRSTVEALRKHDVIAPLVGSGGARMLLRLVGHTLGLPGVGLASLLDPSPLAGSLDRWIDWRPPRATTGRRATWIAVCVVATLLPRVSRRLRGQRSRPSKPCRERDPVRQDSPAQRARPRLGSDSGPVSNRRGDGPARRGGRLHRRGTRPIARSSRRSLLGADKVIVIGFERSAVSPDHSAAIGGNRASPMWPQTCSMACLSIRSRTTCAASPRSTDSSRATQPGPIGSPRTYRNRPGLAPIGRSPTH